MRVRVLASALAAAASICATALVATPASALVDTSRGTPGFCPDDSGVTVVVDFQALGGETIVRCAPGDGERVGLEALKDAGFEIGGVQRWGESFICRIENRPAPAESLAVSGNDGYKERCIDTPPTDAHWSYWHAPDGGDWQYSGWGVKNRSATPGGFEGWSFSLNSSGAQSPAPRIAPDRPDATDSDPAEPDTSDDPADKRGASDDSDARSDPDGSPRPQEPAEAGEQGDGPLPPARPRATTTAPAPSTPTEGTQDGVEWTGGDDVDEQSAQDSGSSPVAPWVGGAVLAGLALLIVVTTVRRRRTRTGG